MNQPLPPDPQQPQWDPDSLSNYVNDADNWVVSALTITQFLQNGNQIVLKGHILTSKLKELSLAPIDIKRQCELTVTRLGYPKIVRTEVARNSFNDAVTIHIVATTGEDFGSIPNVNTSSNIFRRKIRG